jgi:hypothetical protein
MIKGSGGRWMRAFVVTFLSLCSVALNASAQIIGQNGTPGANGSQGANGVPGVVGVAYGCESSFRQSILAMDDSSSTDVNEWKMNLAFDCPDRLIPEDWIADGNKIIDGKIEHLKHHLALNSVALQPITNERSMSELLINITNLGTVYRAAQSLPQKPKMCIGGTALDSHGSSHPASVCYTETSIFQQGDIVYQTEFETFFLDQSTELIKYPMDSHDLQSKEEPNQCGNGAFIFDQTLTSTAAGTSFDTRTQSSCSDLAVSYSDQPHQAYDLKVTFK